MFIMRLQSTSAIQATAVKVVVGRPGRIEGKDPGVAKRPEKETVAGDAM